MRDDDGRKVQILHPPKAQILHYDLGRLTAYAHALAAGDEELRHELTSLVDELGLDAAASLVGIPRPTLSRWTDRTS